MFRDITLSKSQKKIARELIRKGLLIECNSCLDRLENLLVLREKEELSSHDIYLKVFKKINSFDHLIQRRYDGMTGSRYLPTIIELCYNKILNDEDIARFDPEIQEYIHKILSLQ